MNISNADDISGRLMQAAEKLNHEAYRDIDITINGVKTADLTPARLASLYRGEQLIVFGHYWGSGKADITITGKTAADTLSYKAQFEFPKHSTRNPELERLWAYASIEDWQNEMDYLGHNPDTEQAIVDTAVAYGLVTDYTSLLVVRESVFEQLGIARDNAARVAIEQQAQAQRSAATQSTSQQHALNSPRAYPKSGGAGAVHPLALLLVLPLLYQRLRNNRRA
jgi:Ca-activated chloride channel family protein